MTAPVTPPIEWFRDPGLTELTPLTVHEDGRVVGHVAGWSTQHVSFPGRKITPPRSRMDYSLFHVGSLRVQDGAGHRDISVGRLMMSCPHAGTDLSARDAFEFYADTGASAAVVCAHEDQFGIAIAGALEPDLDELATRRFKGSALSGDWRAAGPGNSLELVGVIAVNVPGFPIPRARVASGAPLALVAAGALPPRVQAFGRKVDPTWVRTISAGKITEGKLSADIDMSGIKFGSQSPNRPFTPADLAAQLDAAFDRREKRAQLAAERDALLAAVDDAPARHAALVASLDGTAEKQAALLAALDEDPAGFDVSRMPPQLKKEWLTGKVAAKIRWGTDGDFDRCVLQAKAHDIPAVQQKGLCSNLHREAVGGKNPGEH